MPVKTHLKPNKKIIYNKIKEEIVSCTISPQQVLVVDSLATRFEVSRTPVREALLALSSEGLVEAKHRIGFIVTSVDAREMVETFGLRILLEKEAARLAAERISKENLEKLESLLREPSSFENRKFHTLIAESSGWGVLAQTIETLLDKSARARALFIKMSDGPNNTEIPRRYGHFEILVAIKASLPGEAAEAMEKHLEEAKNRVLKKIADI